MFLSYPHFTWIQQIGQEEIRITEQIESEYGNKSVQHSRNVYLAQESQGDGLFSTPIRVRGSSPKPELEKVSPTAQSERGAEIVAPTRKGTKSKLRSAAGQQKEPYF